MKPPSWKFSSSQTPSSKASKDPEKVALELTRRGMPHGGKEDLDPYPEFKSIVEDVLHSERGSAMKPESAQRVMKHRNYYSNADEDSVLQNILPLIIKKDYMRNLGLDSDAAETAEKAVMNTEDGGTRSDEEQQWVSREWFSDGVATSMNCDFLRGLLPTQGYVGLDPDVVELLAKEDGMTNPRPDYCYGLRIDKFTVPLGVVLISDVKNLLGIAPGMEHAFFIIGGKSNKGSMGEAENQARRGGATLVNAGRKLLEYIEEPDVSGADSRTFVCSATATPNVMAINVHWAEVLQDHTLFHMTHLKSKLLCDEDHLPRLRATLHNILSWGCIDRLPSLIAIRQKLYACEKNKTARLAAPLAEYTKDKGKMRQRRSESEPNEE